MRYLVDGTTRAYSTSTWKSSLKLLSLGLVAEATWDICEEVQEILMNLQFSSQIVINLRSNLQLMICTCAIICRSYHFHCRTIQYLCTRWVDNMLHVSCRTGHRDFVRRPWIWLRLQHFHLESYFQSEHEMQLAHSVHWLDAGCRDPGHDVWGGPEWESEWAYAQ